MLAHSASSVAPREEQSSAQFEWFA